MFDFPSFYSFAFSWFKDEDLGVIEKRYVEKVNGNKREITIEWEAAKELSDYFKQQFGVKFKIEFTDVEVEVNGKKEKMNQGKISVEIKGVMIRDHKNKWEKSAFSRFMRDFYNKFVIPGRVDQIKNKIKKDVQDFKEEIKAFLALMGRR